MSNCFSLPAGPIFYLTIKLAPWKTLTSKAQKAVDYILNKNTTPEPETTEG
jgi:hypothetical protein